MLKREIKYSNGFYCKYMKNRSVVIADIKTDTDEGFGLVFSRADFDEPPPPDAGWEHYRLKVYKKTIFLTNLGADALMMTLTNHLMAKKIKDYIANMESLTDEATQAEIEKGVQISLLLRMVGIDVRPETAWLIFETIYAYGNKSGEFNIKDAVKLIAESHKIFEHEE